MEINNRRDGSMVRNGYTVRSEGRA